MSVAVEAVAFLLLGAMADFGSMRKKMWMMTSFIGASATIMYLAVVPGAPWLGGLLIIVANVALGTSIIFYNSFLPLIVKNHPNVRSESDIAIREQIQSTLDHQVRK